VGLELSRERPDTAGTTEESLESLFSRLGEQASHGETAKKLGEEATEQLAIALIGPLVPVLIALGLWQQRRMLRIQIVLGAIGIAVPIAGECAAFWALLGRPFNNCPTGCRGARRGRHYRGRDSTRNHLSLSIGALATFTGRAPKGTHRRSRSRRGIGTGRGVGAAIPVAATWHSESAAPAVTDRVRRSGEAPAT
jgi:hypothetical protein